MFDRIYYDGLRAENAELHKAIDYQANVQLQLQSLNEKAALNADSNALRVWCLQAEANVAELKGKIEILERRSGHREDPTTTSAALGPLSFHALSGLGSGLTTQASPQPGEGMSGLGAPRASTLPLAGRGATAFFAGPVPGPAASTPFPSQTQDQEGATCFHQARIWGRQTQLQGNPKGLVKPWIMKGQVGTPRRPWSLLVLPAPRLTRTLTRVPDQGPVPHLSKSEPSRLADRVAALGHGTKLLTYPEELGFLTTHSGAEFGWGRSSDLCACNALLAVIRLHSSEHSRSDSGAKEDGPDAWS